MRGADRAYPNSPSNFWRADLRAGAGGTVINLLQHNALNHRSQITSGVLQTESASILQDFFRKKCAPIDDDAAS
jgi:hypothetical protein